MRSAGWWLAGLLLCWRFLGPFVVSDFSRGGQVAGSPAPFYLTRQQADHNHQQQGGSSFSWLRVVQNRRPWASSVFPSTPLNRRGFIIVVTPMWVYSFVRNGHGAGPGACNNYSPFSWFKRPQPPAMVLLCTPASPQEGSRPRCMHKAEWPAQRYSSLVGFYWQLH